MKMHWLLFVCLRLHIVLAVHTSLTDADEIESFKVDKNVLTQDERLHGFGNNYIAEWHGKSVFLDANSARNFLRSLRQMLKEEYLRRFSYRRDRDLEKYRTHHENR